MHFMKQCDSRCDQRYTGGLSPSHARSTMSIIESHFARKLTTHTLASSCGLSASHYARAFRRTFGVSVHQCLLQRRIKASKSLLLNTSLTLAVVALRSGFSDQPSFTRAFHHVEGLPPGRWRKLNPPLNVSKRRSSTEQRGSLPQEHGA